MKLTHGFGSDFYSKAFQKVGFFFFFLFCLQCISSGPTWLFYSTAFQRAAPCLDSLFNVVTIFPFQSTIAEWLAGLQVEK